jgi:Family of unknown function (DUF5988)
MNELGHVDSDAKTIRSTLEGGPADLPERLRRPLIAADAEKLKVMHRGGYEHFTRDPESARRR